MDQCFWQMSAQVIEIFFAGENGEIQTDGEALNKLIAMQVH